MIARQLLKKLREERGLSQRRLAALTGVRAALICRLETGKQIDTQTHVVERLARFFNLKLEDLVIPSPAPCPFSGVHEE